MESQLLRIRYAINAGVLGSTIAGDCLVRIEIESSGYLALLCDVRQA